MSKMLVSCISYFSRCIDLFPPILCLLICCFYFCVLLNGFPVRFGFSDCRIPVVIVAS